MNHPFPANGRYQVLGTLGKGGFGAVYRALDREAGREVAIKVSLEQADPQRLSRFRREGELTARLDHPGIVRVHSAGEVGGYPYLVYELIEGSSLADVLPVTHLRRRVELIRDAARALAYAHEQGVVHRDVKAENVLVDAQGRAFVADFGLASANDVERLTRTGASLGTPTHMSPEQVEGRRELIGPPSDVWSLGVLLYQALTDELPFVAPSAMELIGAILHADVQRPSRSNVRAPRELDGVCLRALEREAARRYPHAGAFADDLDRWLEGKAVQGGASRSRGAMAGLGLAVLGALCAALYVAAGDPPPTPDAPPEARTAAADPPRTKGATGADPRAERALRTILRKAPSEAKRAALEAWLGEHSADPSASQAREALEALETVVPRVVGVEGAEGVAIAYWLDDQRLLVVHQGPRLRCYALSNPREPLWEQGIGYHDRAVVPTPDGEGLVIDRGDEGLTRLDIAEQTVRPLLQQRDTRRLAFARAGELLVTATRSTLAVHDWPQLDLRSSTRAMEPRALAVSPRGNRIAVAGGSWGGGVRRGAPKEFNASYVRILRLPDLKPVHEWSRPTPPTGLAWDGDWIYESNTLGEIERFRVSDPEQREAFDSGEEERHDGFGTRVAHTGSIVGLVVSDGVLFSACRQPDLGEQRSEFRAWSTADRRHLRSIDQVHSYRSISLSPNGEWVALGTLSGFVEVYRARVAGAADK